MSDRVMIDIETLGRSPGCVVLSIGACRFDPVQGVDRENTFYVEIDPATAREAGLEVDQDTREWWDNQDPDLAPLDGDTPLRAALSGLTDFCRGGGEFWANSPSFDLKILDAAYEAVGRSSPWEYWEHRDVRTVRNLPTAVEVSQNGREHHALDDAIHQAREVGLTLRRFGEVEL